MGYALAEAARDAGAKVILISGPVSLEAPERITRVLINSADEMLAAVMTRLPETDIFIGAAAVADYRPENPAEQKIKKHNDDMHIYLVKNPDIIATVAEQENKPFKVGCAAETQNVLEYAQGKLEKKNLDLIIANDVSRKDIGFNSEENAVTLVAAGEQIELPKATKTQVSRDIVAEIAKRLASDK